MANYNVLKSAIQQVIYANGNQEITGDILQGVLLDMIDALGLGYQYAGIAETTTNPGTPDERLFYVANGAGTYTHFDSIVVDAGELAFLKYDNGGWSKDSVTIGGSAEGAVRYDVPQSLEDSERQQARENIGTIGDAPSDNKQYARKNRTWEEIQGSSVEIVNDLTTGGADKALSAEQGKVVGIELKKLNGGNIDIAPYEYNDGKAFAVTGTAVDITGYECAKYDVSAYRGKELLIERYGTQYCLVYDEQGTRLTYWTGNTGIYKYKIPATAKNLYLSNLKSGGTLGLWDAATGIIPQVTADIEALKVVGDIDVNKFLEVKYASDTRYKRAQVNLVTNKVEVVDDSQFYHVGVLEVNGRGYFRLPGIGSYALWYAQVKKPFILIADASDNVISQIDTYNLNDVIKLPSNARKLYFNGYYNTASISWLIILYKENPFVGKTVAIIGDSISTTGRSDATPYKNAVEMTISEEDVGVELSAYPTIYDVNAGLTIGGHTFTLAELGTEVSFTPTSDDVGKVIGIPNNYYNDTTYSYSPWWNVLSDKLGFNPICVSWSGASICSHEASDNYMKASYGWHPATIRKCGTRIAGTMQRTAPDVIIIFRGVNDMTHKVGDYAKLTPNYFDAPNWQYPITDALTGGGFGFKEGYALTIAKLREAYPNAMIYICTLTTFKRVNYTHFPTNNGLYTLPQLNNAIREIADFFGCGLIELDKCGITFENCYNRYISDSATTPTHPNNRGHAVMAARALNDLMHWGLSM